MFPLHASVVWFARGFWASEMPKMAVQVANYQQWGGAWRAGDRFVLEILGLVRAGHVNTEYGESVCVFDRDYVATNSVRFEV